MKPAVGVIGLGLMGRPMSMNILKAGYPLTVWNRTASRAEEQVAAGARLAKSPHEVAAASDFPGPNHCVATAVSDSLLESAKCSFIGCCVLTSRQVVTSRSLEGEAACQPRIDIFLPVNP